MTSCTTQLPLFFGRYISREWKCDKSAAGRSLGAHSRLYVDDKRHSATRELVRAHTSMRPIESHIENIFTYLMIHFYYTKICRWKSMQFTCLHTQHTFSITYPYLQYTITTLHESPILNLKISVRNVALEGRFLAVKNVARAQGRFRI